MDGTWSTEDAVAVFGPVVAAGLIPFADDDVLGDDLHRDVVLRGLAPQLGAAFDVGLLDPCRVEAYVRASVGHRAAVVAAGVALTLADAPLLPVAVLDDALPELFGDLARADDACLLGGSVAMPEAPAVPLEVGAGGPVDPALPGAPAVPPEIGGGGRRTSSPRRNVPCRPRPRVPASDAESMLAVRRGVRRRRRRTLRSPSGWASADLSRVAARAPPAEWSCYRTDHT